jgi:hypothetical protein
MERGKEVNGHGRGRSLDGGSNDAYGLFFVVLMENDEIHGRMKIFQRFFPKVWRHGCANSEDI